MRTGGDVRCALIVLCVLNSDITVALDDILTPCEVRVGRRIATRDLKSDPADLQTGRRPSQTSSKLPELLFGSHRIKRILRRRRKNMAINNQSYYGAYYKSSYVPSRILQSKNKLLDRGHPHPDIVCHGSRPEQIDMK